MNFPFAFFAPTATRRAFALGLLAACLTGCASQTGSRAQDMPALMTERLSWMDEVALVKKVKNLPVTDARREAELLDAMVSEGAKQSLPAEPVRAFFRGQIEAAKVCQQEWLKQHANHPPPPGQSVPDLATTVRPALDVIGKKMLAALADARGQASADAVAQAAEARLKRAGYSDDVIAPAVNGLAAALK